MRLRSRFWLVGLFLSTLIAGCRIEGRFNTADPPKGEIYIDVFTNNSPNGPATLSQDFTEDLKSYFQRNARGLDIINSPSGDSIYILEGSIVGYENIPQAPNSSNGQEATSLSRLKITVKANYIDYRDKNKSEAKKQSYSRNFSFYSDFPSEKSLSDVEDALVPEITEQIIIDIFSASFDNW